MKKEHPNIDILNRLDLTNLETSSEIIDKDFVWHYYNPELPDIEGDYIGLSGLMDFFKILAGHTKGSFRVNPLSITTLGDEIVITHVKDTMFLEGNPMEIDAIVVWCIIDGKIKETWDIPIIHTAKILEAIKEKL